MAKQRKSFLRSKPKEIKIQGSSESTHHSPAAVSAFEMTGKHSKPVSPLNDQVWRLVLVVASGTFCLWLLSLIAGIDRVLPAVLGGALAILVWAAAVRLLLLDARFKVFWLIWLSGGLALLMAFPASAAIWVAAATFSGIFLLFRKYRPFSHLTSRRRAMLFLLAVLMFSLMSFSMLTSDDVEVQINVSNQQVESSPAPAGYPARIGRSLLLYGFSSLGTFWFLSLFHLFFRIRLHFMRLRPKLAVSAFLLVLVPMFLVTVMGLLTLYGTLGESRAIRASNILRDWAQQALQDPSFVHSLSADSFVYVQGQGVIQSRGTLPADLPALSAEAEKSRFSFADWNPALTGAYFLLQDELWLLAMTPPEDPIQRIWAGRLDAAVMDRLARMLHSDVKISYTDTLSLGTGEGERIESIMVHSQDQPKGVYGRLRPDSQPLQTEATKPSIWDRNLYFGVSSLSMMIFDSSQISWETVLILLESRLSDIAGELAAVRNPLSQVVLVILLVLAILLLIMEMFALFFGVRITSGITSSVRLIHRGTQRIAQGDLETRIDIPNEDELGDLAAAINEMAAAVKLGREQAIARERLESELETARKIQERLLPDIMPDVPGFEIAGTSLPSQQVGGDYFDFLDLGKGQLGIAIADVSGKGIPAALLMANLQASLHAQVIRPGAVAEVTARINDRLVESTDSNMFATFFYGILDRHRSLFTSTNAGHNPPFLIRHNGQVERLEAGGLLLGFLSDQQYAQNTINLEAGDVLVLFTDGVTEAVDTSLGTMADNLFGEERLIQVIKQHKTGTAREMQKAILAAIFEFTGKSPQSDDITLVVIKRILK